MEDQPIHLAAERGDLADVQRLCIDDPSLVEVRGGGDQTALMEAARESHAVIVEWLIDHAGANIEARNSYGATGLHLSIMEGVVGYLEVVSILLNRGADINGANVNGLRPLMVAAWYGDVDVVKILLSQQGIDLDAQDEDGCTALWHTTAYHEAHEEVVRLLLEAGADPRIAHNDGRTPFDRARERGHGGCIQLLEAALVEPERARLLHRARAINDAHHAANKVARETEGRTRGERKRKMIAAAPAYLNRRVGEGRDLPQVEVRRSNRRRRNAQKEKLAAVVEHMVMDGQVPSEVFVELMEMMLPKWDDERRRV